MGSTSLLSESARLTLVHDLTNTIRKEFSSSDTALCIYLLTADDVLHIQALVDALLTHVHVASIDNIVTAIDGTLWIVEPLLTIIASRLEAGSGLVSVAENPPMVSVADIALLRLARRLISIQLSQHTAQRLLHISLVLIQHGQDAIAAIAKDLSFALLSRCPTSPELLHKLGDTVLQLLQSPGRTHKLTLAYALSLRILLLFPEEISCLYLEQVQLLTYTVDGLLRGDNEQRKLSLELLRLSVPIAVNQGRTELVTSTKHAHPDLISKQYAKFLTVFETIVLARYGNLIAEAESSLQQLLGSGSTIHARWQYALLEVALQSAMQEQVRRLIGKWVLSGHMSGVYNTVRFLDFMDETFLGWVAEGSLYTASLHLSSDSTYRCSHGQLVSSFIKAVVGAQDSTKLYSRAVDMLLAFFQRPVGLSPFAVVHVLDGWARVHTTTLHIFTAEQTRAVLRICDWGKLPHAARLLMNYCCWRLLKAHNTTENLGTLMTSNAAAGAKWAEIQSAFESGGWRNGVAGLKASQRDLKVKDSIKKCTVLQAEIATIRHDDLLARLEDIWSDVEYLEHPRDLMTVLPKTYFNSTLIEHILQNPAERLQTLVQTALVQLLQQAQTKSYLLEPLVSVIRCTIIIQPAVSSLLDLQSMILSIALTPPEPRMDLRFEYATTSLFNDLQDQQASSISTSFENEGFAAYLDLVSRLSADQNLIRSIVDAIIARWLRQKIPPPSISAFKTSLQLQVLVLCCQQLNVMNQMYIEETLTKLFKLLSLEPLPRYRYLLSWAILLLLARCPDHHSMLLSLLSDNDHHSNPKYLAALMKLSVDLLRTKEVAADLAEAVASKFVALSASTKVIIRHESQWSFPVLIDVARARGWHNISQNAAYLSLDQYIRSLPRYDDPPKERQSSAIDLDQHNTLSNLVEGLWTELDASRPPYTRRADLIELIKRDDEDGLVHHTLPCFAIGEPINLSHIPKAADAFEESSILGKNLMKQEEAVALQTKGSAYLRMLLGDSERTKCHELIVIASLLDNPHNLGGLSRVSEIFGAQTLYVRDPRVIAEKDFTSVAVSSQNHIDIMPLLMEDISTFLATKRQEGWTVVGVEQTDRSVLLGQDNSLPRKSILIIGNERFGMPGSIINECDILVEIPQMGVTRSMNVQTVAAVVLFEYNRQHSG